MIHLVIFLYLTLKYLQFCKTRDYDKYVRNPAEDISEVASLVYIVHLYAIVIILQILYLLKRTLYNLLHLLMNVFLPLCPL